MFKTAFRKIEFTVYVLAFAAGIIIFACAFCSRLPKKVWVNGVYVGGFSYSRAVGVLRDAEVEKLKQNSLEIDAGGVIYSFTYPEINFKDNFSEDIKTIKKSGGYSFETSYYLCGKNEVISGICAAHSCKLCEPYAEFMREGDPFEYHEGCDGLRVDVQKLSDDIDKALLGTFGRITVNFFRTPRTKNLSEIKASTRYISGYTTYYDAQNHNRSQNIALAAAMINGTILQGGQTFSFNDIVGERTLSRGFLSANIIENGGFSKGVGGGVCQVSTTLYNAALLSGMEITEFHPHSLAISYVPPSRDAMVSGKYYDLKFVNPNETPVYIRASTQNGTLKISLFGTHQKQKFALLSNVKNTIPAPVVYTDNPKDARAGKDGIQSECYLLTVCDGVTSKLLLREDNYAPMAEIRQNNAQSHNER